MRKVVIWGVGDLGKHLYERLKTHDNVICFIDNNYSNLLSSPPVYPPSALTTLDFDVVFIASAHGLEQIYKQLTEDISISPAKINRLWAEAHVEPLFTKKPRIKFLEDFAERCYEHEIEGSCAELGVFTGEFAAEINRVFSDRTLYLFDTFEGFDKRDLTVEHEQNPYSDDIDRWVGNGLLDFTNTSVELVTSCLPCPEQAIIKKGFFPQTFDLDNSERFAFVHIDTNLYQSIKNGLELFYPLMSPKGVILVHDYYTMLFGVAKAVDSFVEKYHVSAIPIGDRESIALIKNF